MACKALVSNISGIAKGEILAILPMDHEFSSVESMEEFLTVGGNFEDWSRLFSIVIISDKAYEECTYLDDYLPDQITKKYHFIPPLQGTDEWDELYQYGQITRTYDEIMMFIGIR